MKTLVIYPGRFQPFGKHHFGVYENLKKKFPDADIFIATSNIINKPKSPFGFDLKKEIIEQYGVPGNSIIKVKNPYKCEEIISRVDPTTTAIVFAYGSKDIDRLSTVKKDGSPGYFEIYADSAPLRPLNEKGYIIPVEHIDLLVGSKEMSGTTLRDYIKTATPEEFKEIMGWYDSDIYTEIKMELTENGKSFFFNLITEGVLDKDTVQCLECGKQFNQIQYRHLLYKHNMTMEQYRIKYPSAILISETQKNIGNKNPMANPINKEIHLNSVHQESYRNLQSKLSSGRTHSYDTKQKCKQNSIELWANPEYRNKVVTAIKNAYDNIPGLRELRGMTLGKSAYSTEYREYMYSTNQWIHPSQKSDWELYKVLVREQSNLNYQKYFSEIPNATRRNRTWHLDHKYSIKNGFINNIPPEVISHYKNLEIIHHAINEQKHAKNSITLEELLLNISRSKSPLDSRILLTCGGASGHMKHPFDDRNLTFGEIKDMIEEFLSGDLNVVKEVSEKLDGQNLMVTYKDGEVKAARNKTTIITPMSMSELKTKFDGRGEIYDAFSSAMTDLTIALSSINKTQLEAIFNNGLNFINLEILYPPTKNVIDYGDQLVLVFHGITKFDELGNKVGEITSANSIIQQIVHDINTETETKFKFSAGNIPDLQRIPNFQKKTSNIISIVNKIQQDHSLNDSNTIGDYYRKFWDKFIDSQNLGLDAEMKNILVNRWANDDRSVKLTRNTFKNNLEVVKKLEANIVPKYNMKLYSNLEIIFLKVGTLVLENLTNVLSANPDKTVQFIKSELESIIANVRSSNDPAGLAKVNKYLKKLNVIGGSNSIVPTEGLVFTYKGKRYKLTGTFSPVNQILGLYKFKR